MVLSGGNKVISKWVLSLGNRGQNGEIQVEAESELHSKNLCEPKNSEDGAENGIWLGVKGKTALRAAE